MSTGPNTTPDWDARSYDRVSEMQLESGRDFLARVPLRGDEVAAQLEAAGFAEIQCELEERRHEFDEPREFQRTVGLAVHLNRLPEELHEEFVDAVLAGIADPSQVRLIRVNVMARRSEGGDGRE